jgi:DNA repair protein RecO (recombination protein O)
VTQTHQERVLLEAAYVLHQRPWRDTSRIVELLSRSHGRCTVFSRGSRKSGSRLGAVLQPFSRVLVSWSGRGEAGTLMHAEFDGSPGGLAPARLMSGFYLNELLIRLLPRHDPHPEVFELYEHTLDGLRSSREEAAVLRVFEKRLLEVAGYGLSLTHDARTGRPVESGRTYRFVPGEGAVESAGGIADGGHLVQGATLIALTTESFEDPLVRAESRSILRLALEHCLDGRGLRSREVLRSMRRAAASAHRDPAGPDANRERAT